VRRGASSQQEQEVNRKKWGLRSNRSEVRSHRVAVGRA
jgi:hypothetical protein